MMSSEEETDCLALYGASTADSKQAQLQQQQQQQLLKKQKRTRQRVDAGEPRNSYSSIPNFSSRPSFLGGGLYGALFGSASGAPLLQQQSSSSSSPTHQPQQGGQLSPQQPPSPAQQQQQQQQAAAAGQGPSCASSTQQQQHGHASAFGFFGAQGFGPPNKMLNELFGRQVKQATDAGASPPEGSHGMAGAAASLEASGASPLLNCADESALPGAPELTQHMLREILQGRKLGALSVQDGPTNNNSIHNNNNTTQELLKSSQLQQHDSGGSPTQQQQQQNNGESAGARSAAEAGDDSDDGEGMTTHVSGAELMSAMDADADGDDSAEDAASAARAMEEAFAEAGMEPGANLDASDCDASLPSSPTGGPRSASVQSIKEEQLHDSLKRSPSHSPCPLGSATLHKQQHQQQHQQRPESPSSLANSGAEMKRARVENIVSTMRSSPAPQPQQPPPPIVNGCKKRKLYHPQQQTAHHVLSQHAVVVCSDAAMLSAGEDDESDTDDDYLTIRQKREEKATLKSQLNKLHHEVALMQQKWAELTSRMSSEILGAGSTAGDVSPPEPALSPQPQREQHREQQQQQPLQVAASLAQMQVAAAAAAGHQQPASARHHRAHHAPPAPYNGAFASISHEQAAAAAMYQMVNHKFYLEQERYASTVERLKQQQQQHHEAVSRQQEVAHRQQQEAVALQAASRQQQHQQQIQQQHHQHHHHQQQQHHQQQGSPQPRQEGSSSTSSSAPHTPRLQKSTTPLPQQQQQKDLQESLSALRGAVELASNGSSSSSSPSITGADLELLADKIKSEVLHHLSNLVDDVFQRFLQQKKFLGKQADASQAAADQLSSLNKDLMLASQFLERKSPRTKVVDRGAVAAAAAQSTATPPSTTTTLQSSSSAATSQQQQQQGPSSSGPRGAVSGALSNGGPTCSQLGGFSPIGPGSLHASGLAENNLNQLNQLPHPHSLRPSASMFQQPKPPTIFGMSNSMQQRERDQYCASLRDDRESRDSEQNEALSLVMTPKKKRHKVTDTRITPRTVSRMLGGGAGVGPDGSDSPPPPGGLPTASGAGSIGGSALGAGVAPVPVREARAGAPAPPSAGPGPYHAAPPMLPVSLPTSVAIPNPSLHESQVFSPYSPFFSAAHPGQAAPPGPHHLPASPPAAGAGGVVGLGSDARDQSPPPLHPPPTMLHPALLAAAQHGNPDFVHLRIDSSERSSDCNSADIGYDGIQPTSSTLTPMHLRKAKLMFFWVRYPSSAVLKMYFPDIKFNKNNTAQLVKWFSNFREFYYIQMEKYARQAVSEGVKTIEDLQVGGDSEIYRVLNLHYNRNNHIEVPPNFRYVVEQTLKEFFKAIQGGKDTEQSWKKSIYKVISRLDDPVPEYFKSPNFLEQLE